MTKVLVTEDYLGDIADAIRAKNGGSDTYTPGQMAGAIAALPGAPNLQSKTVTENGTVLPDAGYDGLSSVVVNVSGGGGSVTRKTESEWNALSFSEKKALGLTVVGEITDITGNWYDYSIITVIADMISAAGNGAVDTKTITVSNYANYEKLAVFVAVNDNNDGTIKVNSVSQVVTKNSDVYCCSTVIDSAASFTVTIGHGDGGSAMYSVAVFGINGMTTFSNSAVNVSGTSDSISVANSHSCIIVDLLTDRVSGTCTFDGMNMIPTQIGSGYFGSLYHSYLILYMPTAGTKALTGPSGVKCFQIVGLD